MLETHNAVMRNPSARRFFWIIYHNFPLPAHVYLLCALRYRTNDEFAEKAWQQLSESAETRMKTDDSHFFAKKKDSMIHLAFGNMTVKAWDAREAALRDSPQAPPVPRFVTRYRKLLAQKKSQKEPATNESSPSDLLDQQFGDQMTFQFPMLDPNAFSVGQGYDQSITLGSSSIESGLLQYPNFPQWPPTAWALWNDLIQSRESVQAVDTIPPSYNFFQN
jgi:hypothetical protein